MQDNYVAKVYGKDGKICASMKNVSINTAYRALPFMIEDAIKRGEGTGDWDVYGEEMWHVQAENLIRRIRDNFLTTTWFDTLSNEGEATILTIKVRLES
jgi:hypothetical protein